MSRQLESMDLNLVNALYWILVERSVTGAGERLGLSQPAASRALGRLRNIYRDPLVVKSGREMVPTPLGEALLPLAAQAVEALRHVVGAGARFDPASHGGTFRIACKDALGIRILELWEREIRPLAPQMSLDFVNLEPAVAPDVVSGRIDMVVMPLGPSVNIPDTVDLSQFVVRRMCEDPFVTCLRADHPLVVEMMESGAALSAESFAALDHILINLDGQAESPVDEALAAMGLARTVRYRSHSFYLAKAILRRTDCALTVSGSLVGSGTQGLWLCAPPVEIAPQEIHVGWHPNWTTNPRHMWVRERLMSGLKVPPVKLQAA